MDERAAQGADRDEAVGLAAEQIAQLRASGSVFAEEEHAVLRAHAEHVGAGDPDEVDDRLETFIDRRVHGERIEHILEHAQFAELRVEVDFGVFVPRSRTVLLATVVDDRLRELRDERPAAPPRLLDFGCGSGAIAALAMHRVPGIEAVAADSDRFAVACAERNLPHARVVQARSIDALVALDAGADAAYSAAAAYSADAPFSADAAFDAELAAGRPLAHDGAETDAHGRISASAPFDVVAANLPYVPTEQLPFLPRGTLESEPRSALDGGESGLDPLGEHATGIAGILRDGGMLVTELAPHQVELGIETLELAGFTGIEVRTDDELGATVLVGRR